MRYTQVFMAATAIYARRRSSSKSRTALRLAKQALNGIEAADVDRSYRFEQGFTLEMYMSPDSQKSRDAFVESKGRAEF